MANIDLANLMNTKLDKAGEEHLTSSNNLLLQVGNALKSLPADKVAKAVDVAEIFGENILTTYLTASEGSSSVWGNWPLPKTLIKGKTYKVSFVGILKSVAVYLRKDGSSDNDQVIGTFTEDGTYEFVVSKDDIKKLVITCYRDSGALDLSISLDFKGQLEYDEEKIEELYETSEGLVADSAYLKKAVGNVDTSEETKTYFEFGVGRITGSTTPTTAANWFYSSKILNPKAGDKIVWDGTKCLVGVCLSTGETSVYVNTPKNTGEYTFPKGYSFAMLTGYTNGAAITEDDIAYLEANVYHSTPKAYKSHEQRIEALENGSATVSGVIGKTYIAKPSANGNTKELSASWLDTNAFPNTNIWGWEYLQHWYEKIYNADQNVIVALSGDSITQGFDPATSLQDDFQGMRNWAVKKIMQNGSFPAEMLRVVNCGVGGRTTNEWVGNYHHADLTKWWSKYTNGFLHKDMELNPDLYILAWGMNDADKTSAYLSSLTLQQRVVLFEQNMREGLGRIRTNTPVVDGNYTRPAYNKSSADMSIIICLPTCCTGLENQGRGNEDFNQYAREVIRPLCREFECAFADLTNRTYGHTSMVSKIWSIKTSSGSYDGLHPNKWANAQIMSSLQDLIYPSCLWNSGTISMGDDDNQRYFPKEV